MYVELSAELLTFARHSPDGGIGRRARLKIWFRQRSAGSIPVLGTKKPRFRGFFIANTFKFIPNHIQ